MKKYYLQLSHPEVKLKNQRNVEHLFVHRSAVKINLNYSIQVISRLVQGQRVEVLFSPHLIHKIRADFERYEIDVLDQD